MEKVLNMITMILTLIIALLCFIAIFLDNINILIQAIFVILILVLLAAAPFRGSELFGVLNNPIGRPLVLVFVSGFYFPVFEKFCTFGWINCLIGVASLIGVAYGGVLLIINLVLICMKKSDPKKC